MKWLLAVTFILVVVTRTVQSAPMMEGCKRWRGCGGVDPKGPKTSEISIDDIPKDMARYYLKKLLESKDFIDKFRNKSSQSNVPGFDLGAKRLRISRKLQAIVRRHNT